MIAGPVAPAAEQPNILWLTSEDHGPHVGCYGDRQARTPNIDALAAKGMRTRLAWSGVPVCAPARTMIITGVYPSSSGGLHMRSMVSLPREIRLFPEFLRSAGYYCTNNSKEDYNVPKPDGLWDESSKSATWQNRPAGKPFFAVFNSVKSHESQLRTRPHQRVTDPATVRIPAYHPDTPEVREDWAQYYDKVSEADADAGQQLKQLADAGLSNDTIVFYFADHGSGMPRHKRWPSNSGLQVPFVMYFPERWRHLAPSDYQVGGESQRLISFVDLAPTMLSLIGVEPPKWMQGQAFAGSSQSPPRDFLFGERGRMDERADLVRSVTDGRYVYLRNYNPHVSQGQHLAYQFETPTTRIWRQLCDQGKTTEAQSIFWHVPKAPEELYDLNTDPDEVRNLSDNSTYHGVLTRLRAAQKAHSETIRDVCLLPEGEMHTRSEGTTPFEMARDPAKYSYERVLAAAELASGFDPADAPQLLSLLADSDSAVRYWAALGFLIRGKDSLNHATGRLQQALRDDSPYVRIVAAEVLLRDGASVHERQSLETLKELMHPSEHGVFVAMAALNAIEALGKKAEVLREEVRTLDPRGPSPSSRFNEYVPRLVKSIVQLPVNH